jgi:hypothetical protein
MGLAVLDRYAFRSAISNSAYFSEPEIAVSKVERYKSPGIDQSPAELIQVGSNALRLKPQTH